MAQKSIELGPGSALERIMREQRATLHEAATHSVDLEQQMQKREEQFVGYAHKLTKLEAMVRSKNTVGHRVVVDLGGGALANVTTELLNWGLRALGRWSQDGWWARNEDILQGLPHFVLGLMGYIGEVAMRGGKLPSMKREVFSEFAKLFSTLGAANLFRAIRLRSKDAKTDAVAFKAMEAERDMLAERLRKMGQKS